ncbi:MAG: metallophosphoesterase [Clostridia bacterium]|nr:metallophosphoesterase [Clostridia bacterium]
MLFPGHVSPQGRHAGAYDPSTSKKRTFMKIMAALLILLLLAWPFIEPYMLETESVSLLADDLPSDIGQLRILYATDIHKGGSFTDGRLRDLVSRINACNADLVLLGGDYAQDSAGAVAFFQSLPRIYARYGVYAVVGNHDRTTPESNLTQLRTAMLNAGVTPLINDVARVRIGLSDVYLAGIDDVNCGHPDLNGVASRVSTDDYVIFLSHSPEIIPQALRTSDRSGRSSWYDLGLFGHTHGGQIIFLEELLDRDGVPNEYTQGWLRQNRIDMLVSRGVGTSGLPVRLLCRPQIHLITIRSAK